MKRQPMPPATQLAARSTAHLLRVPAVLLSFWIIKTLSTTVCETGADFLSFGVGLGMPLVTALVLGALGGLLWLQFSRLKRFVPANYWAIVVLMSVAGTLITDMLVDLAGVSLVTLTAVFSVTMLIGFALWYRREGTLSIHSIDTAAREGWYWGIILLAFALGTGVGDLIAEQFALGYATALALFAGLIGTIYLGYRLGMNPVLAFWLAYVLTRPLGAALGDFLIQPLENGGLAIDGLWVNLGFLSTILVLVIRESLRPAVAKATAAST